MDQSTHDVRRANWLNIITECQQRPVNVSVKQWLADNGVKEKAYYYWLRKFRREACGQIQPPAVTTQAEVSFAEFNVPASVPVKLTAADHAVATIRANGITLEIADDISEALLRMLVQEVIHA
ncbi:MAG: IS66 family insertion sequence element accessory protein TnpB [Lachnospiraceae bacterium]|nr:IS66 family insertion sequence element accessory protein TnpB [Lachnospiraceae bacterium]